LSIESGVDRFLIGAIARRPGAVMHRIPPFDGYGREERPLLAYTALTGLFAAGLATFLTSKRGRDLRPMPASDVLLMGAGVHKIAHIAAKDSVTSPFRAPFVTYVDVAPGGDLRERSRGRGLRRAVGDLVTCPYCLGPWVASGLLALYAVRPAAARFVGGAFALVTVSDFLNKAYAKLQPDGRRRKPTGRRGPRAEVPPAPAEAEHPSPP
jgi:hypothetical protein